MNRTFPDDWSRLSVVLAHDWLIGMRGGERVLETLCRGFPSAPVYTLFADRRRLSPEITDHRIVTSWLQHIPGITRHYRYALPLFPSAIRAMEAPPADLLVSTSHSVIKGLRKREGTRHLCYCFTPMRHLWSCHGLYTGRNRFKTAAAGLLFPALRKWDRNSAQNVDLFVAVSRHIQQRILDVYGRESDLVYPPVDTQKWTPALDAGGQQDYDLVASALVPYKRVDLAISAYTKSGQPLKVVGIGSESKRLRSMAGRNIEFLGWRSDRELLELYRSCRLFIFPGEEDFGIAPVEAQACGRPVIAFGHGGATETVRPGVSGLLFQRQDEDSLLDAVRQAASMRWDAGAIRANAERFDTRHFIEGMAKSVETCLSSSLTPAVGRSGNHDASSLLG